jgi:uncharacterized protein YqiB (DUF1249 family)
MIDASPKPEVGFAILHMGRGTCVGCSEHLRKLGLIEVIEDVPMPVMNLPPGSMVVRHYRLAPGVTLAECQHAVRHRHRGARPWGME